MVPLVSEYSPRMPYLECNFWIVSVPLSKAGWLAGDIAAVYSQSMDPAQYRPASGEVPLEPGVYRFLDPAGSVIYVGKAKNLRMRLMSYFADLAGLHPRTQQMVTTACKVVWTVVNTEVEALALEYAWIKEHSPRFNVKYRDDKSYPSLAITMGDKFPRVMVTRETKKPATKYFGPYSHAWAIRETVDQLLRVFPMRTCTRGVFQRAERTGRPCLHGYIDKCSAPCVGRVTAEEHRQHAQAMVDFMSGKTGPVLRRLEQEMKDASADLDFETAARRRDDLGAIRRVLEKNAVVLSDDVDADILALHADEIDASVYGFHIRGGRIRAQRGWVVSRDVDQTEGSLMEMALQHIYAECDPGAIPREVLVSVEPTDLAVAAQWLSQRSGRQIDLRIPQRGDKRAVLHTASKNAAHALAVHKTRRAGDLNTRSQALAELGQALDMDVAPLRIECFDVSTLHGTNTVASMVVFEDGLPRKSDYRRFTITGDAATSDVAAMHQTLTRRFKRLANHESEDSDNGAGVTGASTDAGAVERGVDSGEAMPSNGLVEIDEHLTIPEKRRTSFAYPPQLVVVDGGQPQVQAAQAALAEVGANDVAVCGLAKRLEEIWLPDDDYPVILPRTSPALYLMQQLRDEAHRFAISHHRTKRGKKMIASELDGIPGLGPKRQKLLLEAFGSLKNMDAATEDEIAAVKGVGPKLAAVIKEHRSQTCPNDSPAVNVTTGEVLE